MFEDAEKIVKSGKTTYWKDGVMIGRKCSKCGEDKPISEFGIANKKKNQYRADCKSCRCNAEAKRRDNIKSEKVKSRELLNDEWKKENWEEVIRINKQWLDNVDGLEMKVGQQGNRSFWKDNKIISKYCTKCGELKEIKDFGKRVNGNWKSDCKSCEMTRGREWCKNNKELRSEASKRWRNKNIEKALEMGREYRRKNKEKLKIKGKIKRDVVRRGKNKIPKEETNILYNKFGEIAFELEKRKQKNDTITYWKDGVMLIRKCTKCGQIKRVEDFHFMDKEKGRRYPSCKECNREMQNNYTKNNKERIHMYNKRTANKRKEKNLATISKMIELINPTFKELNLPIYGYIYKFENVKTGRVYIGQTTQPLKTRYGQEGGIIKSWIKERSKYNGQKFLDELIEDDIIVTELFDVGCCKYHLDKTEAYYIDKYDSCNNGYNNEHGNHITDDGIEEFNKILEENGLKFIDGKLIENNK